MEIRAVRLSHVGQFAWIFTCPADMTSLEEHEPQEPHRNDGGRVSRRRRKADTTTRTEIRPRVTDVHWNDKNVCPRRKAKVQTERESKARRPAPGAASARPAEQAASGADQACALRQRVTETPRPGIAPWGGPRAFLREGVAFGQPLQKSIGGLDAEIRAGRVLRVQRRERGEVARRRGTGRRGVALCSPTPVIVDGGRPRAGSVGVHSSRSWVGVPKSRPDFAGDLKSTELGTLPRDV